MFRRCVVGDDVCLWLRTIVILVSRVRREGVLVMVGSVVVTG